MKVNKHTNLWSWDKRVYCTPEHCEGFQIPAKKTYDDWEKEERNEKNPLLTYEEYISEKFFRIIKKLDEARKNEND